jgi:hypothetical protein
MIASVGQGGRNLPADTQSIQGLLSDLRVAAGLRPLKIDGIVGQFTIQAILDFQRGHAGLLQDGRIDPNGATLKRLDQECAALYAAIAHAQLSALLTQLDGTVKSPRSRGTTAVVQPVRGFVDRLKPTTAITGVQRFPIPLSFLPFRSPLLGAVTVAIEVVIVFLLLLMMLVVIVSNPVWQRAAREMIKGLQDRLRLLSQKIRDAVKDAIEVIEKFLKGSPCEQACSEELEALRRLGQEINDLLDTMPANDNDPGDLKAKQFKLARLHDEFLKAQQAVIDCMVRNGC